MNKEYIEREAARLVYEKSLKNNSHVVEGASAIHIQEHRHILHILNKIPAADVVEVRHGRWIDKGWYGDSSWQIDGRGNCWRVHECSECNVEKKGETTKYCPHCGAKMDKEKLKS